MVEGSKSKPVGEKPNSSIQPNTAPTFLNHAVTRGQRPFSLSAALDHQHYLTNTIGSRKAAWFYLGATAFVLLFPVLIENPFAVILFLLATFYKYR